MAIAGGENVSASASEGRSYGGGAKEGGAGGGTLRRRRGADAASARGGVGAECVRPWLREVDRVMPLGCLMGVGVRVNVGRIWAEQAG